MRRFIKVLMGLVVLGIVAFAAVYAWDHRAHPYNPPASGTDAVSTQAAIERGRYVAIAGDCAACHTNPATHVTFAGGYALQTPFGEILASNITSDRETGIGDWSEAEFVRAVREGKGRHGENLYPAMPYNAYVNVSDADMHDLWAYMRTVAPVENAVDSNQLPFPFRIRALMAVWNLLFFRHPSQEPVSSQSAAWNRGRYLVDGLGHCASCHTAKNALGGDVADYLGGGPMAGWFAADITSDPHMGLGKWSTDDVVEYLKHGGNRLTVASGPMAEAVENSTQHMSDDDLQAIATYLKSVPASSDAPKTGARPTAEVMALGEHLYQANCEACHNRNGSGEAGMIPAIVGNTAMLQRDPATVLHSILVGNRGVATDTRPTGAGMPSFDWKLDDAQVAAIATYVRNRDGNEASAVTADDVAKARKALHARKAM
jgi:mono/diheme cytochrome c family protein